MATLTIKNLPDGLYRKLKARAKRERRSVAQEVTILLTQALEPPATRSILELGGARQGTMARRRRRFPRGRRARGVALNDLPISLLEWTFINRPFRLSPPHPL